MAKLGNVKELADLRESLLAKRDPSRVTVRICATGCRAKGADKINEAFKREIAARNLSEKMTLMETGCHGFCSMAPVLVVGPMDIFYCRLTPEDVPEILEKTVMRGEIIERLLYVDPQTGKPIVKNKDIPFYKHQKKIVLRNCGRIDPTSISDYIAENGYSALAKALDSMSPADVVEEVFNSGLRGRGGAGFSTGQKWRFANKAKGDVKYMVCNADEGDPGAFMDRAVLEGDPHSVLEGMAIAAYAIGASKGYVYVRAEYPIAVKNAGIAIRQAEELGLLGDNILGTDFSFHVTIKEGAGAFVCGEETALMASIEGRRGMPRTRPPFPINSGLWGNPTCINNVETLANINPIILNGSAWYAGIGTEKSKGTKIFALAGMINNTGLVEVPMGITLREIIYDVGGGILNNRKIKAALTGGPSGGCIPVQYLDLPIDYDSLGSVGAIMGSGGMIILHEHSCMVDIARFFLSFTQSESCGKCTPCRIGTKRMLEILTRITQGKGKIEDLDLLEDMAQTIKDSSLCGLGQTAPNPVLSTLRYFRDEYEGHILDKKCRAATCEALVFTPCHHTCPAETDAEGYILLIGEKRFHEATAVIMDTNPFPQSIGRVCFHPCENRCRRAQVDRPIPICSLKQFTADISDFDEVRSHLPRLRHLPQTGTKVAILGAGPGGLTTAYFLARLGYEPVVFDSLPAPGGMLRYGVPDFRLPSEILENEIERIKSFGVKINLNTHIDERTITEWLEQGEFKAVLIATGTHGDMRLGISGEELAGVYSGVKFLRDVKMGAPMKIGKRVVIIGGGNVAIDASRTALRMGADEVKILYRRTRSEIPASPWEIEQAEREGVKIEYLAAPVAVESSVISRKPRAEMPASMREIEEAEREGVMIEDRVAPVAVEGVRRAEGLKCVRMKLGPMDGSGRRKPIPIEGTEFVVECDMIIAAVGQGPQMKFGPEDGIETRSNGTIVVDRHSYAASRAGVFACGDVVTGPASAIEAIGAGKKAAMAIHEFCGGRAQDFDLLKATVGIVRTPPEPEEVPWWWKADSKINLRCEKPFDTESSLSPEEAIREAKRCLRCSIG